MRYFSSTKKAPSIGVLSGLPMPCIFVTKTALEKMDLIVELSAQEVGWLGSVSHQTDSNVYTIEDIFLFPQTVSGADCELDSAGLTQFAMEIMKRPDGPEFWNTIRLWGHSHAGMEVFESGQDLHQMKALSRNGAPWFISGIANKARSLDFFFYDYEHHVVFRNVPWQPAAQEPTSLEADILRQLQEKVKRTVPPAYPYRKGAPGGTLDQRQIPMQSTWAREANAEHRSRMMDDVPPHLRCDISDDPDITDDSELECDQTFEDYANYMGEDLDEYIAEQEKECLTTFYNNFQLTTLLKASEATSVAELCDVLQEDDAYADFTQLIRTKKADRDRVLLIGGDALRRLYISISDYVTEEIEELSAR